MDKNYVVFFSNAPHRREEKEATLKQAKAQSSRVVRKMLSTVLEGKTVEQALRFHQWRLRKAKELNAPQIIIRHDQFIIAALHRIQRVGMKQVKKHLVDRELAIRTRGGK